MPMRDILINVLRTSDYLQADETPVQVMDEPNRKNTSTRLLCCLYILKFFSNEELIINRISA